jgi:hypothetical protein
LTSHVVSTYSHDIGKDYILLVLRGLIKSTTSYTADTLEVRPHDREAREPSLTVCVRDGVRDDVMA